MAANATFLAPGEGETVFTVSSAPIKFGAGALGEVGADAQALGMKRGALFVDSHVLASLPGETALGALRAAGLDVEVYDQGTVAHRCTDGRQIAGDAGLAYPTFLIEDNAFHGKLVHRG